MSLQYTNFTPLDATAKWATGPELLHQCHLTQWVSTVYSSEKGLLWLRFPGISSCEDRQTHLQTRARRWERVTDFRIIVFCSVHMWWELCAITDFYFAESAWLHFILIRVICPNCQVILDQPAGTAFLLTKCPNYCSWFSSSISNSGLLVVCFSELLCCLCGQEPEAIQRQCHGESWYRNAYCLEPM